ncbi:MAG: hypothetical protein WCP30_02175 [Mycobacteriaceae bacterium]
MNAGEQTIDWLYREQLQVDEEWSIRTETGFTWWADQNAQTIEVLGEEDGPDGQKGYLISVRTDLLTDLDLSEDVLEQINEGPMRFAALAAPVYDRDARTLSLYSLARVLDENAEWMGMVLGSAAVLQAGEARLLGPALAEALGAQAALSGHPQSGLRPTPDEMIYAVNVFLEEGKAPCQWPEAEFTETVNQFMMQRPSIGASSDGQQFVVEFPFGNRSSLCQVMGTQAHPLYGNGLFVLQRFPFVAGSLAEGVELALTLNGAEFTQNATGYGFGSYVYDEGTLCFSAFIPNVLHRQVALPNLYFACAARALAMSVWLLNEPWTEESFSIEHSALGRKMMRE